MLWIPKVRQRSLLFLLALLRQPQWLFLEQACLCQWGIGRKKNLPSSVLLLPANRAGPVWPESPSLFLLTSPGHSSNKTELGQFFFLPMPHWILKKGTQVLLVVMCFQACLFGSNSSLDMATVLSLQLTWVCMGWHCRLASATELSWPAEVRIGQPF